MFRNCFLFVISQKTLSIFNFLYLRKSFKFKFQLFEKNCTPSIKTRFVTSIFVDFGYDLCSMLSLFKFQHEKNSIAID